MYLTTEEIKTLKQLIALSALDTGNGCTVEEGSIVDSFDFSQYSELVYKCRDILSKGSVEGKRVMFTKTPTFNV